MAALEKDYEEVGMDSGDMENEDDGDEYCQSYEIVFCI